MGAYVCGIDIGTSGVKVVVLRKDGFISARSFEELPLPIVEGKERFQEAKFWWKAVYNALKSVTSALRAAGGTPDEICSICIDATSGTIITLDEQFKATFPGIMYNDARAENEAEYLNIAGRDTLDSLGYKFNSSFALPKILHIKNSYPEVWSRTKYVLHQADYIAQRLMGCVGEVVTDASNALKTGYDILNSEWPEYIATEGITQKLPKVVATGTVIGFVDADIAREFGFSEKVKIVAGMTDSVAACVASGARTEGDMNTTLGSTITWKLLSGDIVSDNSGRVYSHLHPSGCFLPGGAGNAGGHGIMSIMKASPEELTRFAERLKIDGPSEIFAYPIPAKGERFPFVDSEFQPFIEGNIHEDDDMLYKALLIGSACIERWGYEILESMGAMISGDVWSTGGGAMVDAWMKIRANVLNRNIVRVRFPESAYGAALIAAMRTWFDGDFVKTADNFILEEARFKPDPSLVKEYEEYYWKFRETVERKREGGI